MRIWSGSIASSERRLIGRKPCDDWCRYRRCPRLMPSLRAFCRNEPSVLFVSFIILATGVFAFEWARNAFTSALVYSRRAILFFDFLATSNSIDSASLLPQWLRWAT